MATSHSSWPLTIFCQHSGSHKYVTPDQLSDVIECVCDVDSLQCHHPLSTVNLK